MLVYVILALIPYLAIAFAVGRVLGAADDRREHERKAAGLAPYEEPTPTAEPMGERKPVSARNISGR